jgi:hypothetical protein
MRGKKRLADDSKALIQGLVQGFFSQGGHWEQCDSLLTCSNPCCYFTFFPLYHHFMKKWAEDIAGAPQDT